MGMQGCMAGRRSLFRSVYVHPGLRLHVGFSVCARCGLGAGYMEVVNIDPQVMPFIETMLCTDISAPVMGQLALDIMVNPPKPGDPSYNTYTQVTTEDPAPTLTFLTTSTVSIVLLIERRFT